jgi:hypothetical protein
MAKKKSFLGWNAVTALIGAAYEVASFFGLPPYADNPYARAVAFLIFAGALLRIIHAQSKELHKLYNPDFDLLVQPQSTHQNDTAVGAWNAVYQRISVANNSDITLKAAALVIESWDFTTSGLNSDTALRVKDENGLKADIVGKDRKQFDVFANVLGVSNNQLSAVRVIAPSGNPIISSLPGGYGMTLRLTADNLDTRRYKALLIIDGNQGIRITRIMQQ